MGFELRYRRGEYFGRTGQPLPWNCPRAHAPQPVRKPAGAYEGAHRRGNLPGAFAAGPAGIRAGAAPEGIFCRRPRALGPAGEERSGAQRASGPKVARGVGAGADGDGDGAGGQGRGRRGGVRAGEGGKPPGR
ncbi:hypothetical protein SDC9_197296 [bioreactor metagenome]|uniref:Uncharacterized protein n=1 Tax=bioreactor metagenome TaxID=1076179 RepID=A0A645IMX3_9ZZZZ